MGPLSFTIAFLAFALEVHLLIRARRGRFLTRFAFFYSYVTFVLLSSSVGMAVFYLSPDRYPSTFWFYFLTMAVAEFAVILEASDHIFKPYAHIRLLGRLLTMLIGVVFFLVYIFPPFMQQRSSRAAMFDLVKRTSLTKGVLIIVLLAAARLYRLPLGKNISGMLFGFAAYLALNIVNIAFAERFEPEVYGQAFAIVGPLSFVLGLGIWNIALWRYDPVLPGGHEFHRPAENILEPMGQQLGKYNSDLMRLFRK